MARPKSNGLVKLYELKKDEKFYDMDGTACEFIDCDYDATLPDIIKYRARVLHYRIPESRSLSGFGAAERTYFRFRGRDRSSYMAGFLMAMRLTTKHMGKFELEDTGLDNPITIHVTMIDEYKKWKKNVDIL